MRQDCESPTYMYVILNVGNYDILTQFKKFVRFTKNCLSYCFFKNSDGSPDLKQFTYIFDKIIKLSRFEA